ncbi:MAG: hypothetical protein PHR16_01630 [Methylovulum sp.]|nr:hypothetical protein [Methylovulum sp.]
MALLIVFVGRGSFLADIIAIITVAYLGFPVLFIALAGVIIAKCLHKQVWVGRAKKGIVISAFTIALALPIWGANTLARYDVEQAQAFCIAFVPRLDTFKASTGAYPAGLGILTPNKKRPWLLRSDDFYYSDGAMFKFTVTDEGALMGGWEFSSANRTWQYWD